ncbi:MAG: ribonuclease P [Candidatus Aenigmarchaeota archaeon]|nr:ribonuclease P [Candidatus Aenigmarchaeota archaeon]
MRQKKPTWQRELTLERIRRLFELAEESHREKTGMANRYVELAREMAMHYKAGMPKEFRTRFCRNCGAYLSAGSTSTVRTNPAKKAVVIKCNKCGNVKRFPYGKRKKSV